MFGTKNKRKGKDPNTGKRIQKGTGKKSTVQKQARKTHWENC